MFFLCVITGSPAWSQSLPSPGARSTVSSFQIYKPASFHPDARYQALLVLGKNASSTQWQAVADSLSVLVVCPELASLTDAQGVTFNRQLVLNTQNELDRLYKIDLSRSVLLGTGDYAAFAIELGLRFPSKFTYVAALSPVISASDQLMMNRILSENGKLRVYKRSYVYVSGMSSPVSPSGNAALQPLFEKYGITPIFASGSVVSATPAGVKMVWEAFFKR